MSGGGFVFAVCGGREHLVRFRFAGSPWRLEQAAGSPDLRHDGLGTLCWVAGGRWLDAGGFWADPDGAELGACDHLAERLEGRFGITIPDRLRVPWDGGFFLFDRRSREFLADWRQRCLALFATPGFMTRDQGALVASSWAHRLEEHPRLPCRFNRLVDRRSPSARHLRLAELGRNGVQLVHLIGGELGDEGWPLGRDLAADLRDTGWAPGRGRR